MSLFAVFLTGGLLSVLMYLLLPLLILVGIVWVAVAFINSLEEDDNG